MLTFTKAYKTSDGQTFEAIDVAQAHEIEISLTANNDAHVRGNAQLIAEWIVANKDKLVDVLTTTATSKPSARKINGGRKTRKDKAAQVAPLPQPQTAQ